MSTELKINLPKTCYDCPFNYDGIECRLFKDLYRDEVGATFDPYNERPKWCQDKMVEVKFYEERNKMSYQTFYIELDPEMIKHGSDGKVFVEKVDGLSETAIPVIETRACSELQNRIEFLEGIIEEYYNLCDSLVLSFPTFERKAIELFNKAELPAKKEKSE